MRPALILLFGMACAPALSQHDNHAEPAPQEASACTAEHAAMGHCTMPEQGKKSPATPPTVPDPHAGHDRAAEPASTDPHAGHDMPSTANGPEPGPPPPAALEGPLHAADVVYGADMALARSILRREHGGMPAYLIMAERLETVIRDGREGYAFDGQAWFGGDIDKLWLKGEAEGTWREEIEHAEVQALWSRAIDPWFDLQAGVRYDPQPGPDRAHLVLGLQGLAPHWWEVDGAVFLSNKGELTARGEAEYDLRITQEIILQPRIEIDLSAQDVRELGIGAGLSEASVGARLRYQPTPLFSPYVGIEYERAFGNTARFRRDEGEKRGSLNLLAGIRFFF